MVRPAAAWYRRRSASSPPPGLVQPGPRQSPAIPPRL